MLADFVCEGVSVTHNYHPVGGAVDKAQGFISEQLECLYNKAMKILKCDLQSALKCCLIWYNSIIAGDHEAKACQAPSL